MNLATVRRERAPHVAQMIALIFVALALGGCAALSGSAGSSPSVAGDDIQALRDNDDPLAQRLAAIGKKLEVAGARVADINATGFLVKGGSATIAIDVPDAQCVTLVAIASGGIDDLDATLFSTAGEVVAQDRQPDSHPAIQVCGREGETRHYLHILAYDGAGAYRLGSFTSTRAAFPRIAQLLGGLPGVVRHAAGTARERALELAEGARKRGFEPTGAASEIDLDDAEPLLLPLPVERGYCYHVVALAFERRAKLTLAILDELGRALRVEDVEAGIQICASRDGDWALRLSSSSSTRLITVLLRVPEPRIGGAGALWLGRPTSTLHLAQSVEHHDVGAQGLATRSETHKAGKVASPRVEARLDLSQGEASLQSLRVLGGPCSRFSLEIEGGPGLFDWWVEADAQRLREGSSQGEEQEFVLCPTRPLKATLGLVARSQATIALRRHPPFRASENQSYPSAGLGVGVAEVASLAGFTRVEGAPRQYGGDSPIRLRLSSNDCEALFAYGLGAETIRLSLRRQGRLIAREEGIVVETVVCGAQETIAYIEGAPKVRLERYRFERPAR